MVRTKGDVVSQPCNETKGPRRWTFDDTREPRMRMSDGDLRKSLQILLGKTAGTGKKAIREGKGQKKKKKKEKKEGSLQCMHTLRKETLNSIGMSAGKGGLYSHVPRETVYVRTCVHVRSLFVHAWVHAYLYGYVYRFVDMRMRRCMGLKYRRLRVD